MPGEIYPNANLCPKYILISPDLLSRDIRETVTESDISQVISSLHSAAGSQTKKTLYDQDQVYTLRRQVEFIMTDIIEKANAQMLKLKPYVKFIGYKFEDMLFDLKSLLFQN